MFEEGQRVEISSGLLKGELATILKIDEVNWPGFALIQFDRRNARLGKERGNAILSDRWQEQARLKVM